LVLVIFWIGLYPKGFFVKVEPSVKSLIENAKTKYEKNDELGESFYMDSQQMKQIKKVVSGQWSVHSIE
jgi:hypothetical protein